MSKNADLLRLSSFADEDENDGVWENDFDFNSFDKEQHGSPNKVNAECPTTERLFLNYRLVDILQHVYSKIHAHLDTELKNNTETRTSFTGDTSEVNSELIAFMLSEGVFLQLQDRHKEAIAQFAKIIPLVPPSWCFNKKDDIIQNGCNVLAAWIKLEMCLINEGESTLEEAGNIMDIPEEELLDFDLLCSPKSSNYFRLAIKEIIQYISDLSDVRRSHSRGLIDALDGDDSAQVLEISSPKSSDIQVLKLAVMGSYILCKDRISPEWLTISRICLSISHILSGSFEVSLGTNFAQLSLSISDSITHEGVVSLYACDLLNKNQESRRTLEKEDEEWAMLATEERAQRVLSADGPPPHYFFHQSSSKELGEQDLQIIQEQGPIAADLSEKHSNQDDDEDWDREIDLEINSCNVAVNDDESKTVSSVTASSLSTTLNLKELFLDSNNSRVGRSESGESDSLLEYLDTPLDSSTSKNQMNVDVTQQVFVAPPEFFSLNIHLSHCSRSIGCYVKWLQSFVWKHVVLLNSTNEESFTQCFKWSVLYNPISKERRYKTTNDFQALLKEKKTMSIGWVYIYICFCQHAYFMEKKESFNGTSVCVENIKAYFHQWLLDYCTQEDVSSSSKKNESIFENSLKLLYLLGKIYATTTKKDNSEQILSIYKSCNDILSSFVSCKIVGTKKNMSELPYEITIRCLFAEVEAHQLLCVVEKDNTWVDTRDRLLSLFFSMACNLVELDSFEFPLNLKLDLSARILVDYYLLVSGLSPLTCRRMYDVSDEEEDRDSFDSDDSGSNSKDVRISSSGSGYGDISSADESNIWSSLSSQIDTQHDRDIDHSTSDKKQSWKQYVFVFSKFRNVFHQCKFRLVEKLLSLILPFLKITSYTRIRVSLVLGICFFHRHEENAESMLFESLYLMDLKRWYYIDECGDIPPLASSSMAVTIFYYLAQVLMLNKNYRVGIVAFENCLLLLEMKTEAKELNQLYRTLAVLCKKHQDNHRSLIYLLKVREYCQNHSNLEEVAFLSNSICSLFLEAGEIETSITDLDEVINFLQSHVSSRNNCKNNILAIYINSLQFRLALLYLKVNFFSRAISMLHALLHIIASPLKKIAICSWLVKAYLKTRDFESAEFYLHEIKRIRSTNCKVNLSKINAVDKNSLTSDHGHIYSCLLSPSSGAKHNEDLCALFALCFILKRQFGKAIENSSLVVANLERQLQQQPQDPHVSSVELGRAYYRHGKILLQVAEHPSIKFPLTVGWGSDRLNRFLRERSISTTKLNHKVRRLLGVHCFKKKDDVLNECMRSFRIGYRLLKAVNDVLFKSKTAFFLSKLLLERLFLRTIIFQRPIEVVSQLHHQRSSCINDVGEEKEIEENELPSEDCWNITLQDIKIPAKIAHQTALKLCSPFFLLHSYLNLAELSFLEESYSEGLSYWYESRDVFLRLFTVGVGIPLQRVKYAAGFNEKIQIFLSRLIRFLLCCDRVIVNQNLYLFDIYLTSQYDCKRQAAASYSRESARNASDSKLDEFLACDILFQYTNFPQSILQGNNSFLQSYRKNSSGSFSGGKNSRGINTPMGNVNVVNTGERKSNHSRRRSDGLDNQTEVLTHVASLYANRKSYYQTYPPRVSTNKTPKRKPLLGIFSPNRRGSSSFVKGSMDPTKSSAKPPLRTQSTSVSSSNSSFLSSTSSASYHISSDSSIPQPFGLSLTSEGKQYRAIDAEVMFKVRCLCYSLKYNTELFMKRHKLSIQQLALQNKYCLREITQIMQSMRLQTSQCPYEMLSYDLLHGYALNEGVDICKRAPRHPPQQSSQCNSTYQQPPSNSSGNCRYFSLVEQFENMVYMFNLDNLLVFYTPKNGYRRISFLSPSLPSSEVSCHFDPVISLSTNNMNRCNFNEKEHCSVGYHGAEVFSIRVCFSVEVRSNEGCRQSKHKRKSKLSLYRVMEKYMKHLVLTKDAKLDKSSTAVERRKTIMNEFSCFLSRPEIFFHLFVDQITSQTSKACDDSHSTSSNLNAQEKCKITKLRQSNEEINESQCIKKSFSFLSFFRNQKRSGSPPSQPVINEGGPLALGKLNKKLLLICSPFLQVFPWEILLQHEGINMVRSTTLINVTTPLRCPSQSILFKSSLEQSIDEIITKSGSNKTNKVNSVGSGVIDCFHVFIFKCKDDDLSTEKDFFDTMLLFHPQAPRVSGRRVFNKTTGKNGKLSIGTAFTSFYDSSRRSLDRLPSKKVTYLQVEDLPTKACDILSWLQSKISVDASTVSVCLFPLFDMIDPSDVILCLLTHCPSSFIIFAPVDSLNFIARNILQLEDSLSKTKQNVGCCSEGSLLSGVLQTVEQLRCNMQIPISVFHTSSSM